MRLLLIALCYLSLALCSSGATFAQQTPAPPAAGEASVPAAQRELFAKFAKLLTGAKLRGQFTLDGKPLNDLRDEAYDIDKVEKLPDGDLWALTTRIKYGKHDVTVPIAIEVKWAGNTPVLTMDNMTIPGLGTFSARVVLHQDKYAGTWQHDEAGGHLFGKIELAQ
jgi:hypothetical protein